MGLFVRLLGGIVVRLVPALLTAAGIALVAGGLLTYDATAGPLRTPDPTAAPTLTASPTPLPTIPSGTPTPTSRPSGTASRIVIPAMKVDLPVVEGPATFPYCNVAMYLQQFAQPGRRGTTYIYAHARTGMFLPLLRASQVRDGKAMLGMLVQVYTSDARLYLYEIDLVQRHTDDFSLAYKLPAGVTQQLILQTSEGSASEPKLAVRARFLYSQAADSRQANPRPHIVVCY